MKLKKVSFLIFLISIVNIDAAGNNTDDDECKTSFCISGSVTRTDLVSTDNEVFKVDGEGPDATMNVLKGFDTTSSYKMVNITTRRLDSQESEFYSLKILPICAFLESGGKNPNDISKKLLKMLFAEYEGCSDEPKKYPVPMEISGISAFNRPVPCEKFEMTLRILDSQGSSAPLVTMTVNIVPETALRCSSEEKAKSNDTTREYETVVVAKQIPVGDKPTSESESTPEPEPTTEMSVGSESYTAEELAECKQYTCFSGSVIRTALYSNDNKYFRVNGEGPNATLSVLDGWDTFDTRKKFAVYRQRPGQLRAYSLTDVSGGFCFLPLVSLRRKGDKYLIHNIVKTMLFPGYEGCNEKPKEYQVSTGFSGLFSFEDNVRKSDEFEILVFISDEIRPRDYEVVMKLKVVPDNALSNVQSEGDPEPMPTSGPGGAVEPESTSGPGSEAEPEPTTGSGDDAEPELTTGAGGDTEPEPTTGAGGDAEPESTTEPGSDAEPESTTEPGSNAEPEPTTEPGSDAEPEPTTGPGGEAELEPTTGAGGEAEPESTTEPGSDAEPEPTTEAGGESEPEPTTEAGGEAEPESTTEPGSDAEPEPTSESESTPEPEPTTEMSVGSESYTAEELAECKQYTCFSGSVIRTALYSNDNKYFRVNGEGPNATLSVLDGWDTFDTRKKFAVYRQRPGQLRAYSLTDVSGGFCFLPLVSLRRKGDKYLIRNIVKTMLFPGYEGCNEKPKEYQVSTGFSGLFSFEDNVRKSDEFEILVFISDEIRPRDYEVVMKLKVVPDNALSNVQSEGDPEPMPTSGPGGAVEPESTSGPGSEAEPEPSTGSGDDAEPELTTGAGGDTEPEPTTGAGGDAEPESTTEPGSDAEPESTTEPGSNAEPEPTTEPGSDAEPEPTTGPGGEAEPERTTEAGGEAEPEPTTEAGGEAEPESTTEPAPTTGAGGQAELESTTGAGCEAEPKPTSGPGEDTSEKKSGNSTCGYFQWLRGLKSLIPSTNAYRNWLNDCINHANNGTDSGYAENSNCKYFEWLRNHTMYMPSAKHYHNWLTSNGCIPGLNGTILGANSAGNHSGNATGNADSNESNPEQANKTELEYSECDYFDWLRNYEKYMPDTNNYFDWKSTNRCNSGGKNATIGTSSTGQDSQSVELETGGDNQDKSNKNIFISGSVTRTGLSASDNEIFEVSGEGSSATLRMLKKFNIDDSNYWVKLAIRPNANVCRLRLTYAISPAIVRSSGQVYLEYSIVLYVKKSDDSEPKEYYRQKSSISQALSNYTKDPYPITSQLIELLFGEYEKSADKSKEFSVPMKLSGLMSFPTEPPQDEFEITMKILHDQDASEAELTLSVTVVPENTTDGNGGEKAKTASDAETTSKTEPDNSHCYYFKWFKNLPSFIPSAKIYHNWLTTNGCIPGLNQTILSTNLAGSNPESTNEKEPEYSECNYFDWLRNYEEYIPDTTDYLEWKATNDCNAGSKDAITGTSSAGQNSGQGAGSSSTNANEGQSSSTGSGGSITSSGKAGDAKASEGNSGTSAGSSGANGYGGQS